MVLNQIEKTSGEDMKVWAFSGKNRKQKSKQQLANPGLLGIWSLYVCSHKMCGSMCSAKVLERLRTALFCPIVSIHC